MRHPSAPTVARPAHAGLRPRWAPRFALEMVAASLATLLVVGVWASLDRSRGAPPKIALQAQPAAAAPSAADTQFMEAVALAHLGPLRPDTDLSAPLSPPPVVAMTSAAKRVAPVVRDKPKTVEARATDPRSADAKPARAAPMTAKPDAKPDALKAAEPPRPLVQAAVEKPGFRVPIVSALADKLPTRAEIGERIGALRHKIGDLLPW